MQQVLDITNRDAELGRKALGRKPRIERPRGDARNRILGARRTNPALVCLLRRILRCAECKGDQVHENRADMRADLLVIIGLVELCQHGEIANEIARHGLLRVEQRAGQVFRIADQRAQARAGNRHEQHPVQRLTGCHGGFPIAEEREPARIEVAFTAGVRKAHPRPATIEEEAERVVGGRGDMMRRARDIIDRAVELPHADVAAGRERKAQRKRPVFGATNVEQAVRLVVAIAPGVEARGVV